MIPVHFLRVMERRGESVAKHLTRLPDAVAFETVEEHQHELLAFQAPYLEEKLLREGVFPSSTEYQKAFAELKKFFWLYALTGRPLPMTSATIDEVWHHFLHFPDEYHAFCDRFLGHRPRHVPSGAPEPEPERLLSLREFFQAYKEHFGAVPRLWVDGPIGTDEVAASLDSLAWDCLTHAPLGPGVQHPVAVESGQDIRETT
jgi:hypothetical protein